MLGKSNVGFSEEGGFSNNRFVLKPDVAIASKVSILSKNSLAITDFHAKKAQHVQLFENPFLEPPHSIFPRIGQKNPRAHKNKIGTPPPPNPKIPPPLKRGILWTWVFPAERAHFFQVSIKLAQPFPAPELRTRILRTRGFF